MQRPLISDNLTGRGNNFPTRNAFQATYGGGDCDSFVTKVDVTQAGDASLIYSTYLGGADPDRAWKIAVDSTGAAYVTGGTQSTNFPTQNAFQSSLPGYYNAFVTKLSPGGNQLVYSTFLGGSDSDSAVSIALNSLNEAYITGWTWSTNFPLASPLQATNAGVRDAFVSKLAATGTVLNFSTYLGGSSFDDGNGIAVDSAGDAYVTGDTGSADFPLPFPFQGINKGGCPTYGN
jgi:hypothetical protein